MNVLFQHVCILLHMIAVFKASRDDHQALELNITIIILKDG